MMRYRAPVVGFMIRLIRAPLMSVWAAAAVVRLGELARTGPVPGGDTATYRAAADQLRGAPLVDGASLSFLPPLLPVLMAVVRNDAALAILLALLGALVAPACWALTNRHFGRAAAWIAAALAATEPSFVQWTPYLLTDLPGLSLFAVALERTSVQLASPRPAAALAAGVATGLSYTARAAFALPGLILALTHASTTRRRAVVGAFVLGVGLVFLPFLVRNEIALGEATVYRGQTWLLLWAGTRWNEVGRATGGVDLIYPGDYASWTPEQRDAFHRQEFMSFVTEHPGEWLLLALRKALWFWLPAYPEWSAIHKLLAIPYFCILYALAGVGAVHQRRSALTWLLLACIAATQLTVMATIVDYDDRYRLPVELCLLPLAASAAASIGAVLRRSPVISRSGNG